MLQVWYNGSDWVIAESEEDAIKVWEETVGESWQPYAEDGEKFELDNRKIWNINFDSREDALEFSPPEAKITKNGDGERGYQSRATQDQWIAKVGRDWLCSENW